MGLKKSVRSVPKRNWVIYSCAGVFLILVVLSWPSDQFDVFTPRFTATFVFGINRGIYVNSKLVSTVEFAEGAISLTGKGGISADSPSI
jgi:hypothetical protein